jgi:hypothetical protein
MQIFYDRFGKARKRERKRNGANTVENMQTTIFDFVSVDRTSGNPTPYARLDFGDSCVLILKRDCPAGIYQNDRELISFVIDSGQLADAIAKGIRNV